MTTRIVHSTSGPVIRGKTAAEDFVLVASPVSEPVGTGTTGSQTIRDLTYSTNTPPNSVNRSNVLVQSLPPIQPVFGSATPAVCAVSQGGVTTRVADGVCGVLVTANGDTRRLDTTITTVPGVLAYTGVTAYDAGSLRQYLHDQQLAVLAGLSPGATTQRAFGTGGVGINASCLVRRTAAGYDRPPLDVLDALLGTPGTAPFAQWRAWITPNHFLTWYGHFSGAPTATQRWVDEVCVEYSATPWTGALCRFLPADVFAAKLPMPVGLPNVLGSYISAWARMFNTYADGEQYWVQPVWWAGTNPVLAADPRRAWQRLSPAGVMATGGDSGSPIWTQINGQLVILSHVVMYGLAGGAGIGQMHYHQRLSDFNAALAALNASGTYTVQTVDLSGFANF